jgi:hypothetical protein
MMAFVAYDQFPAPGGEILQRARAGAGLHAADDDVRAPLLDRALHAAHGQVRVLLLRLRDRLVDQLGPVRDDQHGRVGELGEDDRLPAAGRHHAGDPLRPRPPRLTDAGDEVELVATGT